MTSDYDIRRRTEMNQNELLEDSLDEQLKAHHNEAAAAAIDVDEPEPGEFFELPGADLSGEELSVQVLPKQADEFTCSHCFLVQHRSRLSNQKNGLPICIDCITS